MQWQFWIIQTLNSLAFGGLLFLLSSGFSLIFGLMRIPNLAHGAFFMLGAYFGYSLLVRGGNFWLVALAAGLGVGLVGVAVERLIINPGGRLTRLLVAALGGLAALPFLRPIVRFLGQSRGLAGNEQGQVLVTLGISFIIAD